MIPSLGNRPYQFAYVVDRLEPAVERWIRTTGAGPFFLTDSAMLRNPMYRGEPSRAEYRIAMGFCGDVQIELIQQTNDAPSIYRELIDRQGEGYHHFMPWITDFEGSIAAYAQEGCSVAMTADIPGIGRLAYVDGVAKFGGFIELVEPSDILPMAIQLQKDAARDWDGSADLRPLPVG